MRKARRCPCVKGFGRFGSGKSDERCHAPKPGAIPTSLYPDIHFSAMIPRRAVKIKIFLSVVIPVVKAAFVPFSATGGKPAIARATRLCGVSPCPAPDTDTALPKQARYQLCYTRIQYIIIAGQNAPVQSCIKFYGVGITRIIMFRCFCAACLHRFMIAAMSCDSASGSISASR